ncbi:MAG: glycosyltransferase family 39 protein [Planctomycetes bacterium]|nr:glycosyltransferase family 39 protein [Planctomycetota bacterium]
MNSDPMRGSDERTADGYGSFRTFHVRVLLLLTVCGAALRLYKLGEWSFWVDEAHSFRDATSSLSEFWSSNVSNYPLGYLLLRGLLEVVPSSGEGWLRLPFAFFGIVSIPMIAIAGRAIVGRRAALLAAAFLTISPWHIYWSQNARGYAPELLFAMVGIFALHRFAEARSALWGALAALAILGAGAWHPSGLAGIFVAIAFLSIEFAQRLELRKRLSRPLPIVVLLVLLGAVVAWIQRTVPTAAEKKPEFSFVHLAQTFAWFLRPEFVAAAFAGLLLMGLRAGRREVVLLGSWLFAPMLVLVVLGSFVMKVTAQYGLIVLPAALLLAARLIVELADAVPERGTIPRLLRWTMPLIMVASLGSEGFLYYFKRSGDRPRWREAAHAVRDESKGPVLVLATNEPSLAYYLDRRSFYGRPDPDFVVRGITSWDIGRAGGGRGYFEKLVAEAREAKRELWFVLTEPELAEWDGDGSLDAAIRGGAFQRHAFVCMTGPKDMSVLVYRVPGVPR